MNILGIDGPDGVSKEEADNSARRVQEEGFRVGVGGYDRILLDEAARSAQRAGVASHGNLRREEAGATAAAILCASAACEARLSEYLAHYEFASGPLSESLRRVRANRNARQQWRDLLRDRRPEIDLGSSVEYQGLGCLFKLRDVIAHRNARLMNLGTFPKGIEPCVRQRVLPVEEGEPADWAAVVLVEKVAVWAVETAQLWIAFSDKMLPFEC